MIYALDDTGEKVRATPDSRGECPHCGGEMIAKCGRIKTWHWAHRSVEECDRWGEPETEWHLYWKGLVPSQRAEVTIEKYGKRHRADIVLPSGMVIELQHSSLSPHEILQREAFYDSMVWVFDITDCAAPCDGEPRFIPREKDGYHTFRWKHPRKHIAHTSTPTYLDMGTRIMRLKTIHPEAPCGGWGYIKPRHEFTKWLYERAAV